MHAGACLTLEVLNPRVDNFKVFRLPGYDILTVEGCNPRVDNPTHT